MAPFLTQEYKLSKALNKISYFMRILSASFVSSIFPGPIAERVVTGLYTRDHLRQPERPRNLKVMYFQRSFQTLDAKIYVQQDNFKLITQKRIIN